MKLNWLINSRIGSKEAKKWLSTLELDQTNADHVGNIILHISFKGVRTHKKMKTLEGQVVQDADRMDAMGAIGVARCFAFGGNKGFVIHDPKVSHDNKEFENRFSQTSINHFYEKLLLLKDLMNTKTGKKMAEGRHKYMENYLKEFYDKWEGKK